MEKMAALARSWASVFFVFYSILGVSLVRWNNKMGVSFWGVFVCFPSTQLGVLNCETRCG